VLPEPFTVHCKLVHWQLLTLHLKVCCWWSRICTRLPVNSCLAYSTYQLVHWLLMLCVSLVTTKTLCPPVWLVLLCWQKVLYRKLWTSPALPTCQPSKLVYRLLISSTVSVLLTKSRRSRCWKTTISLRWSTRKLWLNSVPAHWIRRIRLPVVWLKTPTTSSSTVNHATTTTKQFLLL